MKTTCNEFDPLDLDRAQELNTILNEASTRGEAVIISLDGRGVTGTGTAELISPAENTNALVRYQRHY